MPMTHFLSLYRYPESTTEWRTFKKGQRKWDATTTALFFRNNFSRQFSDPAK
jgi:hypothetical protein